MTFDKHKWVKREIIASDKLNRIENGVDEAYKIIDEEIKDNISSVSNDLRSYKRVNDAKVKMVSDNTSKISDDFQDYVALNDQAINDLQNQIDGAIDTWYYHGVPTLNNLPASQWENDDTKNNHLRDLYFDLDKGKSYRFAYDGVIYKWILIEDEDVSKALAAAAKAQDTADGKRRVFGAMPYPPYDEGDLWVQGSSGDIKVCVHHRTDAESFYENDWELASKYTDDTKALEVQDNLIVTNALVEDLTVGKADVEVLNAATARISSLESDHVSVNDLTAANGEINNLKSSKANITELESAVGRIDDIESDYIKTSQLNAVDAKVTNLDATKASISQLNAGIAEVTDLTAQKADIDMANVNNAWIENGVIKNNAVTNEQVQGISANKITAGTIDASKINVTNLNADNLTVGTINGQRIGNRSIDLAKLSEEVPTKEYLDEVEEKLQGQIDGQTETWTGDEAPLLNNYPAVDWNTDALKKAHVGDIYYVINAASEVDGYTYRFAEITNKDTGVKSFEWVLVKDTQITKALQDILDIQGEISDIKTFDNQVSSWQTNTDEELGSLKTRATTLETNMGTKVSTNTFNELKQTVDENSSTITSLSDTVATKADGSTVSTLSNTVNAVKQTADQNSTRISNLTTTVDSKADGSTVETLSQKATEIEQDLDGFKTTVSETYQTQDGMSDYPTTHTMTSAINQKASEITSSIAESYSTKDEVTGELTNYYTKTESDQKSDEFATSIASVYQTKDDMSDYSTTEQMNSAINQKADSITSTVSSTYATKTSVPTKVSQLTNDSGYQNNSQVNTIAGNKASAALSDAKDYADDNFDSKGSASAAQAAAISAAATDATSKANAAESNAKADTTNKLKSYYTKTQTDSAITQKADNILSTVNTTYQTKDDMDDYSTTAEMNSAIDQKADSITSTVSQTYATKTQAQGYANTAESNAKTASATDATNKANSAKQAAIDDAASKYYNKTQTYTKSEIEQKAGEISLSVAQEEVSKVEVGGRNLLKNTANPSTSIWSKWGSGTLERTSDGIRLTSTSDSQMISFKIPLIYDNAAVGDEDYIISFDYKSNVVTNGGYFICTSGNNHIVSLDKVIAASETEWAHYESTFKTDSTTGQTVNSILIPYSSKSGWLEIKDGSIKLEKGNKATNWTPAPEDLESYTDTQVNAAKAEIKVTTDNISSEVSKKVGNSEIISKINQSAESVQIQASKVNIEGATLFTNGRLSQSSLNNAYDAKGAAGSAEANAKAAIPTTVSQLTNDSGFQTSSQVTAAVTSGVSGKADKTAAVAEEQYIYISKTSGTTSVGKNSTWVTETGDKQNTWTTKRPTYNSSYPVLFIAKQKKTVSGTVTCTTPIKDDTTTIIDGGNIITGTVNANAIKASSGTFNTANIPVLTSDKINAGAITAEKLDTTDINSKGVLTVGAINDLSNTLSGKAGTSDAIYRQQTIYYRNTTDSAPNVNKTWLSSSGTGYNNWSLKVPKMMNGTTKYPYLFVAVQYQTVNQKGGTACECTTPQKDDSLTIIDGGNITTGTIDATKVTVTNLNADNIKSGKITADYIDATNLRVSSANIDGNISFGKLTNVPSYAMSSDLATTNTNLSTTNTNLSSEITARKQGDANYGVCDTSAGTLTKVVTCSDFKLTTGAMITVHFNKGNTYATGKLQLNVNSTGAKDIYVNNTVTSSTNQLLFVPDIDITFKYSGSVWLVMDGPKTWYGSCSTSADTGDKTANINGCVICKGTKVELAMYEDNTSSSPRLNISDLGYKVIYFGSGTTIRPTKANGNSWLAGSTATFTFDGYNWRTSGKTYIGANDIVTGYLSADRIEAGSLAIGKVSGLQTALDDASKVADNYLKFEPNKGLMIADVSNGTSTIDNVTTGNVLIDDNSVDIRKGQKVLTTIDGDGLTVNDDTESPVASFLKSGATVGKAVDGQSRMVTSGTGMQFIRRNGTSDEVLAHIGYGEGQAESGTLIKPYYSMGLRKSGTTIGNYSMASGYHTTASGYGSYAEGVATTASGPASHAEGNYTIASNGKGAHAEGCETKASEYASHAEGYNTEANAENSHAQNLGTVAQGFSQTVIGTYNQKQGSSSNSRTMTDYAFIIGNGDNDTHRSNAFAVDWNGKVWHSGDGQHNIASYVQTSKGTFVSGYIVVYGKVAQLNFTFRNTSSIAGGATLYEGTLSSNSGWLPKQAARGIGYLGPTPFIMTIGAGGGIIIQNASQATVIIPSDKSAYCTVTYIMA